MFKNNNKILTTIQIDSSGRQSPEKQILVTFDTILQPFRIGPNSESKNRLSLHRSGHVTSAFTTYLKAARWVNHK